jgi:hypothetical protein
LLRQIELSLKKSLSGYLKKRDGSCWWQALPERVQRSATARHRWTVLQIGRRRTGTAAQIKWLSFGDILKALRVLSSIDWQRCLKSETRRRSDLERKLLRVKGFRDYEVAHPKPKRMTNHQVRVLCAAIIALPGILCPAEWARVQALFSSVAKIPAAEQRRLADDMNFHFEARQYGIRRWLACPELEAPERCKHNALLSNVEISWREALLLQCAELDAGRRVFFTYGEPLVKGRQHRTP